jgi:hypothetical protein
MSAMLIGAVLTGDVRGALSALLHIWMDKNATRALKKLDRELSKR